MIDTPNTKSNAYVNNITRGFNGNKFLVYEKDHRLSISRTTPSASKDPVLGQHM